jgi:hypothetical protein
MITPSRGAAPFPSRPLPVMLEFPQGDPAAPFSSRAVSSHLPSPPPPPPRSRRATIGELGLLPDADGFLRLALLRLDLLFERDPSRQGRLHRMERMLEEVDAMDWPEAPEGHPHPFRSSPSSIAELAPEDLKAQPRSTRGGSIRRTGPLRRLTGLSDPRATGSGSGNA